LFPIREPRRCAEVIAGGQPVHPVGPTGPSPHSDKAAAKFLPSLDDVNARIEGRRRMGEGARRAATLGKTTEGSSTCSGAGASERSRRRCPHGPPRLRGEHTLAYATTVGLTGQPRPGGISDRRGPQATTRGAARSARVWRFAVRAISSASSPRLGPSGIAGRQPPA
jgi:hypothetical protein